MKGNLPVLNHQRSKAKIILVLEPQEWEEKHLPRQADAVVYVHSVLMVGFQFKMNSRHARSMAQCFRFSLGMKYKPNFLVLKETLKPCDPYFWGGFPGGPDGKESACNAGDPGSIPGSGKSLGEGNGNPLQYSCLENPMDRGAWRATGVRGVMKSRT